MLSFYAPEKAVSILSQHVTAFSGEPSLDPVKPKKSGIDTPNRVIFWVEI